MIARFPPGINEHDVLRGKPASGSQGRMDRSRRVAAFAQSGKRSIGSLSTCTEVSVFLNSLVEEVSEIAGPLTEWSAKRREKR